MAIKEQEINCQYYLAKFKTNRVKFLTSMKNLINKLDTPNSTCWVCDLYSYKEIYDYIYAAKSFEDLEKISKYIRGLDTGAYERLPHRLFDFFEPLMKY